jgi:hypothetical protein
MLNLSDELKERNILKLILIVRFACATLDVGHPMHFISVRLSNEPQFLIMFKFFVHRVSHFANHFHQFHLEQILN